MSDSANTDEMANTAGPARKVRRGLTSASYLDELWGSIFSFEGGKFFWEWPRRLPYPVSIFFRPPVDRPDDVHRVRQAVAQLGASAVQARSRRMLALPRSFVRQCKRAKFRSKIADSSGAAGALRARLETMPQLALTCPSRAIA